MQLNPYYQVKTSAGTPLTSNGPALASVDANTLAMAYVGVNSPHVWIVYCRGAVENGNWTDNQQVKLLGTDALDADSPPALIVYDGQLTLFTAHGSSMLCARFDGNQWHWTDLASYFFTYKAQFKRCAVCVRGTTLYLIMAMGDEGLHVASAAGDPMLPQSWTKPDTGWGNSSDACDAFVIGGQVVFPWANGKTISYVPFDGNTSALIETGAHSPLLSARMRFFGTPEAPSILYAPDGQTGLYTAGVRAWSNGALLKGDMLLADSVAVTGGTGAAETSAVPSIVQHQGRYCIAHKGKSSGNLWFGSCPTPATVHRAF